MRRSGAQRKHVWRGPFTSTTRQGPLWTCSQGTGGPGGTRSHLFPGLCQEHCSSPPSAPGFRNPRQSFQSQVHDYFHPEASVSLFFPFGVSAVCPRGTCPSAILASITPERERWLSLCLLRMARTWAGSLSHPVQPLQRLPQGWHDVDVHYPGTARLCRAKERQGLRLHAAPMMQGDTLIRPGEASSEDPGSLGCNQEVTGGAAGLHPESGQAAHIRDLPALWSRPRPRSQAAYLAVLATSRTSCPTSNNFLKPRGLGFLL